MGGPGVSVSLGGDGVPYLFDRLTFDAHITGLEDRPKPTAAPAPPPRERRRQYPFTGDIIGFPGS